MEPFLIINVATIIAVVAGGITMGVYLACATQCGYTPSLMTLIVLGWSFLVPLGVTQVLVDADLGVDIQRVVERMALWALFAVHARIGTRLYGKWLVGRRVCKTDK
jgi:hypothetical protein